MRSYGMTQEIEDLYTSQETKQNKTLRGLEDL